MGKKMKTVPTNARYWGCTCRYGYCVYARHGAGNYRAAEDTTAYPPARTRAYEEAIK